MERTEIRDGIKRSARGSARRNGRREGKGGKRARNGERVSRRYNNIRRWYLIFLALTVGPLDVYAAADVDVARTVIHGHLVGPAHLVRHHKTRPATSVN